MRGGSINLKQLILGVFLVVNVVKYAESESITISTHDITLEIDEKANFTLELTNYAGPPNAVLNFFVQHSDIVRVTPSEVVLNQNQKSYTLQVEGIGAGHSDVTANATASSINTDDLYVRITVQKIPELDTFSTVVGWIYFVAWSVSFYPQIYINYKRKSVVGLNFDYVALNILGFTLYSIFNLGLYFIPEIKDEYQDRYPRGLNPVQVNDIFFAVHAAIATLFVIAQCFIYDRADQRVSITARSIMGGFGVFILISIIIAAADVIHWLDFLYYCSYVKLTITLIKYVPQAYMNYKRKSTVGWSIENIFLDFTGGTLSMLQMIVNAYNYDDWVSIFGDPTKFGLGLFSVVFDIFFIVQHYVLYRHTRYEENT